MAVTLDLLGYWLCQGHNSTHTKVEMAIKMLGEMGWAEPVMVTKSQDADS
jgi:hypothetical protein